MPDTMQTLVDEVLEVVDITEARALRELNRRYQAMCARAESLVVRLDAGPVDSAGVLVVDVSATVGEIVRILGVEAADVFYSPGRLMDADAYVAGRLVLSGPGGLVTQIARRGAAEMEMVFTPAPATSVDVTVHAAVSPLPVLAAELLTDLAVDQDLVPALVEGATARPLAQQGEGDADRLEARFDVACQELARRVRRRARGVGPAQIRVQGLNA